ncbi:MAG: hypothetical protein ACKO3T_28490, partial [Planctomycetaceae bacterium]
MPDERSHVVGLLHLAFDAWRLALLVGVVNFLILSGKPHQFLPDLPLKRPMPHYERPFRINALLRQKLVQIHGFTSVPVCTRSCLNMAESQSGSLSSRSTSAAIMPLAESDVKHELRMFFQDLHGYFSPGFKQTALSGNAGFVTRS